MDELRRMQQGPVFQCKGQMVSAILYYKGNDDRVHSWDLAIRGLNLSKAAPDELKGTGLTQDDLLKLNARVQEWVHAKEGG